MDLLRSRFPRVLTSVIRKEWAELLLETLVQLPIEAIGRDDPSPPRRPGNFRGGKSRLFDAPGIRQDLFAGLMRNLPKTVAKCFTEATTVEKPLEMRTRQYDSQVFTLQCEIHIMGSTGPSERPSGILCADNFRVPQSLTWSRMPCRGVFVTSCLLLLRNHAPEHMGV